MARTRLQNDDLPGDSAYGCMTPLARLAYLHMRCIMDDRGVHPAKPADLKGKCLPYDPVTVPECQGIAEQIVSAGFWHIWDTRRSP